MITTENQPKRGTKCYWEQGHSLSTAYFVSLTKMPHAPHAVKIKYLGEEVIAQDCEVFTEAGKLEVEYAEELEFIRNNEQKRGFKKLAAQALKVPYSRILNVCKKAIKLGVSLNEETKEA